MLLDESTSALDSQSEQRIFANLRRYFRRHTIVFISHRLSSLTWVDRVIVVNHGKIQDDGTHDALIQRSKLYGQLFNTYLDKTGHSAVSGS